MDIGTKVSVKWKGLEFTGTIQGIVMGAFSVCPDVMTPEIEKLRTVTFDPPGCIVLHATYIKEITNADKVDEP